MAYFRRAVAYKLTGDKGHAIADFEEYLEIGSDPRNRQLAEGYLQELKGD